MSRHESRQRLAREFGATDIVEARGDEGVAAIKELTDGLGAHSVVEAVGTQESMNQALHATRPGGHVGLRRRRARRRAGRHGPVLEPRARPRRPRPGAPLPARADRPHLEPADRPRQGLRPRSCRSRRPPRATARWTSARRSRCCCAHEPASPSKVAFVTGAHERHRPRHRARVRPRGRQRRGRRHRRRRRPRDRPPDRAGGRPGARRRRCDVTRSEDDRRRRWTRRSSAFGRLDIAFNNAGIEQPVKPAHEITDDEWDRLVAVNLRGVFVAMKHEIELMLAARRRRDRQHLLGRGREGLRRPGRLRRHQARRDRPHQVRRARLRRRRASASTRSAPASSTPR